MSTQFARLIFTVSAICAIPARPNLAAESPMTSPRNQVSVKPETSADYPKLQGILIPSKEKEKLASISLKPTDRGQWVAEGKEIGIYRVKRIGLNDVVLSNSDGKEIVVTLNGSHILDAKIGEIKPDQPRLGKKEWINSRQNPMVFRALSVPDEIAEHWADLTPEERGEIAKWYRDHGWNMTVEYSDGYFGANFKNIYAEERREIVKAKIDGFRASLTAEQRATYEALRSDSVTANSQNTVSTTDGLAKRWDAFRAELNDAQRASLLRLSDFSIPLADKLKKN